MALRFDRKSSLNSASQNQNICPVVSGQPESKLLVGSQNQIIYPNRPNRVKSRNRSPSQNQAQSQDRIGSARIGSEIRISFELPSRNKIPIIESGARIKAGVRIVMSMRADLYMTQDGPNQDDHLWFLGQLFIWDLRTKWDRKWKLHTKTLQWALGLSRKLPYGGPQNTRYYVYMYIMSIYIHIYIYNLCFACWCSIVNVLHSHIYIHVFMYIYIFIRASSWYLPSPA